MKRRIYITALSASLGVVSVNADVAESVIEHLTEPSDIAVLAFEAPSVRQWQYDTPLTAVSALFSNQTGANPCLDPRTRAFDLSAATYTKYKTSTLWGHGSYTNSRLHGVRWNETADADLIYPYVLADSVGGDMQSEVYDFGAGYADHSGRWAWGGSLSYVARLEYRNVDPRPRNVAGTLDLAVSGSYRTVGDYWTGLTLSWRRYKQSNDIDFKSEMGVDKVFHLTGLGNHYRRFAGTGLSTSYDGYRYGLGVDVWPSTRRGAFLSAKVSRFTFRNLLVDMNKLPMARAWHNSFKAQGGYMASQWAVAADVEAYRRHGIENVFGDAQSGRYPLIASNAMYADNAVSAGVAGRWRSVADINQDRPVFTLGCRLAWSHRTEAYVLPYSYTERSAVTADFTARFDRRIGSAWLVGAKAGCYLDRPFGCTSSIAAGDAELDGLVRLERMRFDCDSHAKFAPRCSLSASRTVFKRYMVELEAAYRYERSAWNGIDRSAYTFEVSFLF